MLTWLECEITHNDLKYYCFYEQIEERCQSMKNGVFIQKMNLNFLGMLMCILAFSIGLVKQASAETNLNTILKDHAPIREPQLGEAMLKQHDGLFILDYQNIQLPNSEEIDLIGYHFLTPINDWAYFGLGGYAPVLKGEFGGFMAFGIIAHAQTKITDKIFATAGLSFGGGGGGRSIAHSIELSGTGGYARGYLGLGYDFGNFSAGANISHMKFFNSAINNTQLNFFLQKPFSFATGAYSNSGDLFSSVPQSGRVGFGNMMSFGLDNYAQIDPVGSYKGLINAADLQFSSFMSKNNYWYYALGVGYNGLPAYNQIIAGLGKRVPLSKRVHLYGQLGIGSGGYAPELIDTGSGLLLYPKLSAEYLLNDKVGISLTSGYSFALDGTSKNYTFGVALNHHFGTANSLEDRSNPSQGRYNGYRISLSHETMMNLSLRNVPLADLKMLTIQSDKIITDNFYIPLRGAISYQAYKGFPGYGEVSAGIGVQNSYTKGDSFQFFGELQVGANVEGAIVRSTIGLNYALSEDLALRASVGQTFGNEGFRATNIALGLTRRFSLLSF